MMKTPFELFYLHPELDGEQYNDAIKLLESKTDDEWMQYYDDNVMDIDDEILDEVDEHFNLEGDADDDVPREWYVMCAQMDYLLQNL